MNKDQERSVKIIGVLIRSFGFYPLFNTQRFRGFKLETNCVRIRW